jgi:acetyl esterase/lipase
MLYRAFVSIIVATLACSSSSLADRPATEGDGTTHVPAFDLPESGLLSTDARAVLKEERNRGEAEAAVQSPCPPAKNADKAAMPAIRRCLAEEFYKSDRYLALRRRYPVAVETKTIGGVLVEIFTPAGGIARENERRVLVNLHGGAFICCARTESHTESLPIASLGKIKVISIDYRQAPEYAFPAATDDVVAVYRALLGAYDPRRIGIYGCSAGGLLTAEAIARFEREKLPLPGAIGMFCEGAAYWTEGDSGNLAAAVGWWEPGDSIAANPYFRGTDPQDPLAFPARSAPVMAAFPPSLLITGTRDVALSSVVYTHSLLRAGGVEAELRIWEGMGHGFFLGDQDLPEAREAYEAAVSFFDRHLQR